MKIFFHDHIDQTKSYRVSGFQSIHYRTIGLLVLSLLFICPAFGYAENPSLIDLSAISFVESSNRPDVIGDGGKALGAFQLHKAIIDDFNRFNGTSFKHKDALNPIISRRVAHWAFNFYYPRILKNKNPSRIALLTCWNMGQGSFFLGKRATSYESKYLKALQRNTTKKARVKHGV